MTIERTLEERQSTHGDYKLQAETTQHLKAVLRDSDGWNDLHLPLFMREALDVIMHKIARILHGDPYFKDHWHDIQGYAKLVEEELDDGRTDS